MWVDCKRVNWVFWKLEDSYYVRMYVCTYGRKEGRKEGRREGEDAVAGSHDKL